MHLGLDIVFNGRLTPKNIFAFYSLGFRLAHGFDATTLFGSEPRIAPAGFWRSFIFRSRLARASRPRGFPRPPSTSAEGRRVHAPRPAQPPQPPQPSPPH